ncbi:MAG: AtpZ/AtpI family protein [Phycisphaerales bacterium]|nr:AtpZ/AtpI family protein [Phycisphaerales bacterium]
MPLLPFIRRKKRREAEMEAGRNLYRISGMGMELTGAIVGMTLLGLLADHWLDTSPWLLITGAAVGLVGGFYNFLKQALRENRRALRDVRSGDKDTHDDAAAQR